MQDMHLRNPKIERMHSSDLKRLQDKKLRAFVRYHLYHHHPFYRRMFKREGLDPYNISSVEDLRKIPLTTKSDVMANPKDFVLQPERETLAKSLPLSVKLKYLIYDKLLRKPVVESSLRSEFYPILLLGTSGRSMGEPTTILYTSYDMELLKETAARGAYVAGFTPNDRGQNMFPYAPHLAFWQAYLAATAIGMFSIHTGAGMTKRQIAIAQKIQTTIFSAIPTYLKHFSDVAVDMGVKLPHVRMAVVAGERPPRGLKRRIKDNFAQLDADIALKEGYGSTEMKVAMLECEEGSGFHTYPDALIFEVVDPKTGEPVGEDEPGAIVFSHIDFRGTVFLRYMLGDYVETGITWEKCEFCGRTVPRIIGPIGRIPDYNVDIKLTKIKGTLINLNIFNEVLASLPNVDEYYVEITKKDPSDPYSLDEVIICVGSRLVQSDPSYAKQLELLVKEEIKAATEITPRVTFEDPYVLFERVMGELKGCRVNDLRADLVKTAPQMSSGAKQ